MAAYFHYLKIEKFRGIRSLSWHPSAGVNVILGGGNVGKSTLLEAIALLLSPTNSYTLADADYWSRDVEAEFLIEAVISLPGESAINQQGAMAWPWEWDGRNAVLPEVAGDAALMHDPQDIHALTTYIQMMIENADVKRRMIDTGLARAREFSWSLCADKTIEAYEQVAKYI